MAAATGYGDAPTDEQLLAYGELPKQGRYMAEVLAVRIPATAGGDPPSGAISFHGGHCCSDFIYSGSPPGEHNSQQTCDSQGNIVLTGPSVATSAYGPIVFGLDLHDGSRDEEEEEEEENTGRVVCDAVGGDFSNYNRAISETVRTGYGPAEVIYAVLSNGVQGRVDVKLARLQSRDEEDGVFLGRIVARSKLLDVGCVLFYNEEADKGVRVRPGELVPLARRALAVPLHMPLTIELDLRRSSGDEIVRGQLEFEPAIDGLHTERLLGVNGAEFEVSEAAGRAEVLREAHVFEGEASVVVFTRGLKLTAGQTARMNVCVLEHGLGLGAVLVHTLSVTDVAYNGLRIPKEIVSVLGIPEDGNAILLFGEDDNQGEATYYSAQMEGSASRLGGLISPLRISWIAGMMFCSYSTRALMTAWWSHLMFLRTSTL